jgi:beta-lactamase regulating signal transducer with metallopeptidase domain
MSVLDLQPLAQASVGRILNTLVEGMAIAVLAWTLLRILRNQNSGTRFAVWFCSLLAIAALPFFPHLVRKALTANVSSASFRLSNSTALYLFTLWAAISTFLIFRLCISLWQVRRLRQNSTELDPATLDPALRGILRQFQSPRRIKLCVSDRVRVPAAVGIFRPAVVVPEWALRELSTEELKVVLLHELAHLQRWDDWTNLAQKALKALFFFHPAVWWIERRLALEREMACDDMVLAHTGSPRAYASSLIAFAERIHSERGLALAQAVVGRMRQTSLRIAQILDANRPKATRVWKPVLGLAATIAVLALMAVPYVPEVVVFRDPARPPAVAALEKASAAPAASGVKRSETEQAPVQMASRAIMAPTAARQVRGRQPEVVPASASLNAIPTPELLLVVESTEYDRSGTAVWSLCVWRVSEGKDGQQQLERTVVLNSL